MKCFLIKNKKMIYFECLKTIKKNKIGLFIENDDSFYVMFDGKKSNIYFKKGNENWSAVECLTYFDIIG